MESFPEDDEHVEPFEEELQDDIDVDPEGQFPRFAAYADNPGEEPYYHFCIIEPKNFVIQSMRDLLLVYEEIIACGQEYPGMVPVVHLENLND